MARSVLVVENNDHMRRVLTQILEKAGAEVVEAQDGVEAMQRLEEGLNPAAVILEPAVPRLDGFEVLRRMKAHPNWKRIPVVVCSARGRPEDIGKAKEAGAVEYVLKPNVTRETVIPALKRALAWARGGAAPGSGGKSPRPAPSPA